MEVGRLEAPSIESNMMRSSLVNLKKKQLDKAEVEEQYEEDFEEYEEDFEEYEETEKEQVVEEEIMGLSLTRLTNKQTDKELNDVVDIYRNELNRTRSENELQMPRMAPNILEGELFNHSKPRYQ